MKSILKSLKKALGLDAKTRARTSSRRARHPIQSTPQTTAYELTELGTDYGGWVFVDRPQLHGATIISAGLGEDASFDVAFAAKYQARVILVDPTPRAIAHYDQMAARFGQGATAQFSKTGQQDVAAYDLRTITKDVLQLVPKALWNETTRLRFFEPTQKEHVSHSIVNYQQDYASDTDYINVDALRITDVMAEMGLTPDDIPLIKLDIEGAEIEVILDLLAQGIRPGQILVEYDELNKPSQRSFQRVDQAHEALVQAGYQLIYTDGKTDFLYIFD